MPFDVTEWHIAQRSQPFISTASSFSCSKLHICNLSSDVQHQLFFSEKWLRLSHIKTFHWGRHIIHILTHSEASYSRALFYLLSQIPSGSKRRQYFSLCRFTSDLLSNSSMLWISCYDVWRYMCGVCRDLRDAADTGDTPQTRWVGHYTWQALWHVSGHQDGWWIFAPCPEDGA